MLIEGTKPSWLISYEVTSLPFYPTWPWGDELCFKHDGFLWFRPIFPLPLSPKILANRCGHVSVCERLCVSECVCVCACVCECVRACVCALVRTSEVGKINFSPQFCWKGRKMVKKWEREKLIFWARFLSPRCDVISCRFEWKTVHRKKFHVRLWKIDVG